MGKQANQIIGLYRRHALAWARLRGSTLVEQKWLDRFMALLPAAPAILNLGCGSGQPIAKYFVAKGCTVTGIDTSRELIEIAKARIPEARWMVSDMRDLRLDRKFQGIVAWNSTFHLTPDNQRAMFAIFERHALNGTVLMFTSGPSAGEQIGEFEGEALYHASLSAEEYRHLLDQHGFEVVDHIVKDPQTSFQTVWLAKFRCTD